MRKQRLPYWATGLVIGALAMLVAIAPLVMQVISSQSLGRQQQATGVAAPLQLPEGELGEDVQVGALLVSLTSAAAPVTGINTMDVAVVGLDGKPVNNAKVTFDTDMTNMSHGLYLVDAQPAGDGRYSGQVNFSMGGPWRIHVGVQAEGQPESIARFIFRVTGQ